MRVVTVGNGWYQLGKVTSRTKMESMKFIGVGKAGKEWWWKGLGGVRRLAVGRVLGESEPLFRTTYKATEHPVVFCHGLFGFDTIGFKKLPILQFHYWQGIKEAYEKVEAQCFFAKVPSVGSIKQRAYHLHNTLETQFKGKKVNLVGHSMGGLDCRYLITHIPNKSYQVISLTSIVTPHRGSSFADWCRDHLKVGYIGEGLTKLEQQTWFEWIMGRVDFPAYANLTTDYCQNKFNSTTPDDPTVAYYSINAYLPTFPYHSLLYFPWTVISDREGPNDGLVSLKSAEWGQLLETIQADHNDFILNWHLPSFLSKYLPSPTVSPPNLTNLARPLFRHHHPTTKSRFDKEEFYLRLVTFLHSQGF